MSDGDGHKGERTGNRGRFLTTHWTVVRDAGDPSAPGYGEARAALCEAYWYPLYVFLRRSGTSPQDAEDLVQGFLLRMLDKDDFRLADRERGKFRSFLLAALKNFAANEHKRATRLKRGGGAEVVSIDVDAAERSYAQEPVDGVTPEKLFERSWALHVLDETVRRLETEWRDAGKGELFDALKGYLTPGGQSETHGEIAKRLGLTEGSVKVSAHRLRKAYRAQLRGVIAETVSTEKEVEEEIRELFGAFGD